MHPASRPTRIALAFALVGSALIAATTGTVTDRNGAPVAGAVVTALTIETQEGETARLLSADPMPEPLAIATSDAKGRFFLAVEDAPFFRIRIDAAGFESIQRSIVADEDSGVHALNEAKESTLVITAAGKPVPDAVVTLGAQIGKSDAEGKVRFRVSDELLPTLRVFHPELAPLERPVSRDRSLPRSVALSGGTAIRGLVVDSGDRPVARARITVDGLPHGTSGEDGSFTIPHAPESWDEIVATSGDRIAVATRRPRGGEYTLTLEKGATISGNVISGERTAMAGALVTIRPGSAREARFRGPSGVKGTLSAIADARGNFSITPVPGGTWLLEVERPGYVFPSSEVSVRRGERASRTLSGEAQARVSGVVVDEEGRPVAGARIRREGGADFPMARMITLLGWSGPDGKFVLPAVAPDRDVTLLAAKSGYPAASAEAFEVSAGERKSGITIVIPRGIEVAGKVIDADGNGIANASITVSKVEGMMPGTMVVRRITAMREPGEEVYTGNDGTFTLRMARGKFDIIADADGYAPNIVRAIDPAPEMEPLVLALEEGFTISGRVVRADGTGVPDVSIMQIASSTASSSSESATTGPDGAFTLADLPRGSITISAVKISDFIRETRTVEAPSNNVVIQLAPGGGIRGRVVEKGSKQPVTDFQAGLSGLRGGGAIRMIGPSMLKSFRGDDGSFELTNLPAGPADLIVEAPGFVRAEVPNLVVEEGKVVEGVEVVLEPGTRLSGRVLSPDGGPVSGARVEVQAEERRSMAMVRGGIDATTDGSGEYSIQGIAQGEQRLRASRDGFVADVKTIEVDGEEMRQDFRLGRGQDVSGIVVTDTGLPVADADVSANTAAGGGGGKSTKSDSTGTFRMSGLPPGRYSFRAMREGYVSGELTDIDIAAAGTVRITMSTGGTVSGRVSGLAAADLASVMVMAMSGSRPAQSPVRADGSFRIEGVTPGTARVQASIRGLGTSRSSRPETVEVAAGTDAYVELDFETGYTMRGRVTRGGQPVAGANVAYSPKDRTITSQGGGRTDADGMYEAPGLEAGEYNVMVFDMARMSSFQTSTSVRGSGTFDLEIQGKRVGGRVVDASTNQPIESAAVVLEPTAGMRFGGYPTTTGADGGFSFEDVAPGSYQLRASKDGFGQEVRDLSLSESSQEDLELRLHSSDGVSIRVVDARDGRELRGFVSIVDGAGRVAWEGVFDPSGKGSTVVPLAAGSYRSLVNVNGYAPRTFSINAPSGLVTIGVSPGGSLRIEGLSERRLARILESNGEPWRRSRWSLPPEFPIDSAGARFDAIAPGSYTLEILDGSGASASRKPFTIVEGQATVVTP